jgi:hypothetical protein
LVDFRTDAQISSTLKREMEEELFGRDDVDSAVAELRITDPLTLTVIWDASSPLELSAVWVVSGCAGPV